MKSYLFFIAALGTIATASASMLEINGPLDQNLFDAQVNEEKTHFETLGDLFKVGKLPDLEKISNIAWSGRCFDRSEPNTPHNAGYIFRKKAALEVGPIGATSKSYESFSYWKMTEQPNYFDKMDMKQVFSAVPNIKPMDAEIKSDSIEINLLKSAILSALFDIYGINTGSKKSNLKVSGNYLVEEISGPRDIDVGPLGKVVSDIRCYYFIPDLNH